MNSDEWQDVSREQLWKALDDDGKAFVRELADVFGNITFVHGRVKHGYSDNLRQGKQKLQNYGWSNMERFKKEFG